MAASGNSADKGERCRLPLFRRTKLLLNNTKAARTFSIKHRKDGVICFAPAVSLPFKHTLLPPPLSPSGELELCVDSLLIGCRAMFGSAASGFPEPGLELVARIKYGGRTEEAARGNGLLCICTAGGGRRSPNHPRPGDDVIPLCAACQSAPSTHVPLAGRLRQRRPAESAGCKNSGGVFT